MVFSGQVWFEFGCRDAWMFYRFVRSLAEAGETVSLEWRPTPTPETEVPVSVHAQLPADARARFLHAMFGLTFLEDLDAGAVATVERALAEAGIAGASTVVDRAALSELADAATELGVVKSPSLYRHGPVVAITLTPAALGDDPVTTAEAILAVADNDGIWELSKP